MQFILLPISIDHELIFEIHERVDDAVFTKIAMQCLGSFFLVQHISSFLDSWTWTYYALFTCAQKCVVYKEH